MTLNHIVAIMYIIDILYYTVIDEYWGIGIVKWGKFYYQINVSLSINLLFRKNTIFIILTFNILQEIHLNKTRLLDSLTFRRYNELSSE
jgi:hypothetical protein